MNEDLMLRIAERFSIEEMSEAALITNLADIDLGFVIEEDDLDEL
jgi:hypothetical protein